MSKVRINDLARELEVKSRAILDALTHVGVTEKKTHSSSLEEDEAERVRQHFQRGGRNGSTSSRSESEPKQKIDWSRVSKPGDVLKAIQQRKEEAAAAAQRPSPSPALRPPTPPSVNSAPSASSPVQASPIGGTIPPAAVVRPPAQTPPPGVPAGASSPSAGVPPSAPQTAVRLGAANQIRPNQGSPLGGQGQRLGTPQTPPPAPRRIVPQPRQEPRIVVAPPPPAPAIAAKPPAGPVVARPPLPGAEVKPPATVPVARQVRSSQRATYVRPCL